MAKICPECHNENICPDCKNEKICPDCINQEKNDDIKCEENKNKEEKNEETGKRHIELGIIEEPFLGGKKEDIIISNDINALMETIFEKLKNDDILNNCEDLKITFKTLKEEHKNEIIEGIKIKIDNEEQEKRFNNLLELLC